MTNLIKYIDSGHTYKVIGKNIVYFYLTWIQIAHMAYFFYIIFFVVIIEVLYIIWTHSTVYVHKNIFTNHPEFRADEQKGARETLMFVVCI